MRRNRSSQKKLPRVIPPKTVVRRNTPKGRRFRVGYYSKQDGLDVIWLVNELGEYEQTWSRVKFENDFVIERMSKERDYYGRNRPVLRPLRQRSAK